MKNLIYTYQKRISHRNAENMDRGGMAFRGGMDTRFHAFNETGEFLDCFLKVANMRKRYPGVKLVKLPARHTEEAQ